MVHYERTVNSKRVHTILVVGAVVEREGEGVSGNGNHILVDHKIAGISLALHSTFTSAHGTHHGIRYQSIQVDISPVGGQIPVG